MQTWEFQFYVVADGDTQEDALEQAKELIQQRWFEPNKAYCLEDTREDQSKNMKENT